VIGANCLAPDFQIASRESLKVSRRGDVAKQSPYFLRDVDFKTPI
jgi:hypothetical protein